MGVANEIIDTKKGKKQGEIFLFVSNYRTENFLRDNLNEFYCIAEKINGIEANTNVFNRSLNCINIQREFGLPSSLCDNHFCFLFVEQLP